MERTHAIVQTEISLHQLIDGLEQLAKDYPVERLVPDQAYRIKLAADVLLRRLGAVKTERRSTPRPPQDFNDWLPICS